MKYFFQAVHNMSNAKFRFEKIINLIFVTILSEVI